MGVWRWSPQRSSGKAPGQGVRGPEAESFLSIGHPKEGANWPHVRVLNERNCNFGERGLMKEGKGCSRRYKYKATVCKRNKVVNALHFGMADSVTDRQTDRQTDGRTLS